MSEHILRRSFLKSASFCGLALGLENYAFAVPLEKEGDALEKEIHLHITKEIKEIDGKRGSAYLINGTLPGPTLSFKEGQRAIIHVHNHLDAPTSLHWHGLRLPYIQDGVPGLSFKGIEAGSSFTYSFPILQSGTYWYHSHSEGQEPCGMYGALIIEPKENHLPKVTQKYPLLLSEWSDVSPAQIMSNLKMQDDYYNFRQRSIASLSYEAKTEGGICNALKDRLQWSSMRMSATDISDVSGVIYSYLMNGKSQREGGWFGIFIPQTWVRLQIINAAAMTLFDVRIPGVEMRVVEADGNAVEPITIDEFRIGVGETYCVDVFLKEEKAYTIFAQSEDRTSFALGILAPKLGMKCDIPQMEPRPVRTMMDMGMMKMGDRGMAGMKMLQKEETPEAQHKAEILSWHYKAGDAAEIDDPGLLPLSVENQMQAQHPRDRTQSPGDGLEHNGRRVLHYGQLKALLPSQDQRPPEREIILHATGNMERYIWGFNGRKFSQSGPIRLKLNERVRIVIINDTMMEHPLHLHGLWSELENGQGERRPLKHTIISQPGSRMSFLVTADVPGFWAYHCHLVYHMMGGMFRTVLVS